MGETYIGIDVGTTFLKGAVLDTGAGEVREVRRAPAPSPLPGLGRRSELDPAAVVAAVRGLLDDLLDSAPGCRGVVLCTQMHSVVLVDGAGRALTGAATWLDQRTLDQAPGGGTYQDALAERLGPQVRRELGNELRPGLPIATLFWLAERGELPPGGAPLTLADYALAQICGAPPGVDITNAAASGAFDVVRGAWHGGAIQAAGLGGLSWPAAEEVGRPVGEYRGVPCYRPVGDAQCALLGAGLAPGELSVNIATGSQVSLLQPAPALGDFQTRPFFGGAGLATISGIPAGRALNVLVGLLTELAAANGHPVEDPWPYLLRAAEDSPDTELRVQLGFFGGAEGEPGAIEGVREGNLTAGGLLRASFRRMAASYAAAARRLIPGGGWARAVLSGGLAHQSALLRELIAAELGAPWRLAPREDTLAGLLALARRVAGATPSAGGS